MGRFLRSLSSIRAKLTTLFLGGLLGTSVLLGIIVDRLVHRSLMEEFDVGLQETSTAILKVINSAWEEVGSPSAARLEEEIDEVGIPPETAFILDVPGSLPASRGWDAQSLSFEEASELRPLFKSADRRTVSIRGRPWRVLRSENTVDAARPCRLFLFRKLGRVDGQLRLVRRSMLLALLPLTFVSTFVGFILAGRVLAPVSRIAAKARQVQADGLDARIAVENPEDEFGKLANVLNELLARLQGAFEGQRQFLADAAHELRTPIAVLRTQIEVTLQKPRSPWEYAAVLESLQQQAEFLSEIVNDLMFLARAEATAIPLKAEVVDLVESVDEACRSLKALAESSGVSLIWELGEERRARLDPHLFRRALTNLIVNAVRHSPRGSAVRVEIRASDNSLSVEICDEGRGIRKEELPYLFDRYFRGRQSSMAREDGLGLGLAIVKAIMDLHHGTISAHNLEPNGAAFVMSIPAGEPSELQSHG